MLLKQDDFDPRAVDGCCISSVVPQVDAALKLHAEGYDVAAGSRSLAESKDLSLVGNFADIP